ncbi:MAG: metallophosphoesterase family protein [Candidatus Heimdallarchaeaceae archaeon]
MRIAVLSDIHGCLIYLRNLIPKLKKIDMIFIAGDIIGTLSYSLILKSMARNKKISRDRYANEVYGKYLKEFTEFQIASAKRFFKIISRLKKPIFFTHGNSEVAEVREMYSTESEKFDNIFYLGNSICVYNKWVVSGYGFCSPASYRTSFQTPGEKNTDEITQDLSELEEKIEKYPREEGYIRIGLFHEPPLNTSLDYIPHNSSHGGSREISSHILKSSYDYIIAGHIHESPSYEISKDSIMINPGSLVNRRWALLEHPNRKVELNQIKIPLSLKGLIYNSRPYYE